MINVLHYGAHYGMATVIEKNKTERLVARVNPQEKALIQKAAAIEGRKVARFVVQNAVQRARKVIQEAETIRLNEAESSHFIAVPNESA